MLAEKDISSVPSRESIQIFIYTFKTAVIKSKSKSDPTYNTLDKQCCLDFDEAESVFTWICQTY